MFTAIAKFCEVCNKISWEDFQGESLPILHGKNQVCPKLLEDSA